MTAHTPTDTLKSKNTIPIWLSILLIGLGIAAIAVPLVSTIVAETWIAFILISAGAAKITYAFRTREQSGFLWKVVIGVLYVATGIMLIVNPLSGIITLTLLLGSFLLTEGIFEIILAFRIRPEPNWLSVLINGIVTVALGGIVVFQWPGDSPWLLGTAVGASVISTGVSRLMLALNVSANQTATDSNVSSSPSA
ncbi:MAG: HdeD family acid-resistance protein [Leptolyngbyaceae cyanobacterium CSU_1_4]|nr:HdeD family acid-resistance protein [Leptolyngbyaceae cyanobacterium CSU_1_4]